LVALVDVLETYPKADEALAAALVALVAAAVADVAASPA